jgi:hypothetical protein
VVEIDDAEPGGAGHCAGEADYWFKNISAQAIDCAIMFHKNGRYDPASVLTFTLSPGENRVERGRFPPAVRIRGRCSINVFLTRKARSQILAQLRPNGTK